MRAGPSMRVLEQGQVCVCESKAGWPWECMHGLLTGGCLLGEVVLPKRVQGRRAHTHTYTHTHTHTHKHTCGAAGCGLDDSELPHPRHASPAHGKRWGQCNMPRFGWLVLGSLPLQTCLQCAWRPTSKDTFRLESEDALHASWMVVVVVVSIVG